MLGFFIMFFIVGVILGIILEEKQGIIAIIIISILWMFVYGPWAIATLIELLLGFFLVKKLNKKIDSVSDESKKEELIEKINNFLKEF